MKIQMLKKLGVISCLSLACAVVAPSVVRAQSNSGFILFGGVKDSALDYCLDNGAGGRNDRYYLEIKPQIFQISEVIITYPEHFNGKFDPTDMKLRVTSQCRGGNDLEIASATWDQESRRITIIPKEAIPAKTSLRVVLSNVRNPDFGGFYQFDGRVLRADVPVPVYVGSWVITFN
ncbi:MAG: DUF2808 domain-containing protein [Pseudanabaenaceae cyanobacterium bins.39]|nr:DUF2808 domain-containing protein [Pseudanabaenaceae cyanobacterium bins.39]